MGMPVALITGASSGIGVHLAVVFASLGYSLSLNGRNKTALQETADKCLEKGLPQSSLLLLPGDVRLEEAAETFIIETVEKFGSLDILVNTAGVVTVGHIKDASMADFDRIFDTNVRSVYYLIQQAVPHLRKTKGNIINFSAACTMGPTPYFSAYCASKAALNYLTKSLALELAGDGIRINALSLNSYRTGIHERAGLTKETIEEIFDTSRIPLGRVGTLDDIANAVLFLTNNNLSSYMTGVILPLSGGEQLNVDDPDE